MSTDRFQSTDMDSLYGQFLYDRVVSQDPFLRRLRDLVPWQRFTYKLVKYYRGKARQRPGECPRPRCRAPLSFGLQPAPRNRER